MRATRDVRMSRQGRLGTVLRALVGAWSPPELVVALVVRVRVVQWGDVAAEVALEVEAAAVEAEVAAAEAEAEAEGVEGVVEVEEVEVEAVDGRVDRWTRELHEMIFIGMVCLGVGDDGIPLWLLLLLLLLM